ncbi:DNA gyrase subunit A [candidate division KSB1 bacterium]|nr:DNA gyrase subunit A [candidate division KSB1 bacterium]NIR72479.1 DNA gyrase subunit A [candidate division KSB1 bacterium]NIS24064.1 DNA gyrase subunit A [candidate division KSB1 bacterium]NIT70983.1 DNA gyrase subunit A [candidate division KSB1 bacterium]NIU27394.1 DNA gyrase subunit A [candidate division KSB1 bacterium]
MQRDRIIPVFLESEMKDSYIDYSMSVIVSRALPDVRDGLKPVHRRVLYGMNELGLRPNSAYKKSARIVGEVLGKYHPHGDAAVYDSMVRMVQSFSLRYPLVDGQGNFGSVDGDSPAAMRYTEARMAPIAAEILRDLDKNTVNFAPNFDETLTEPTVLPSVLPNLLVNGASGIAVGMATNIPPHNLGEVIDALVALIARPNLTVETLMKYIKGPDFPTGAIIYGDEGIDEAYRSGRGRIILRGRANVETVKSGRENIVFNELPYQVNKANLIEKIAELVRDRKIEGITEVRDESDRDGLRVVIELKRDAQAEVILNQLYKHTQMQVTFGIIMLALVDGQPKVLNLKEMLQHFIDFRHEVVIRRTKYELEKAEHRAHILEGLKICLDNIDEIVELIKKSRNPETARNSLIKRFKLSEVQAQAILDMRLQRLTGLERKKIEDEYRETIKLIEKLRSLLESQPKRMQLIKEELLEIRDKYADERQTEIIAETEEFSVEDMIAEEDMVITISHSGFIKRFPVTSYRRQLRGGRGSTGATTKDEDFIEHLFIASTHHYILFFTNTGRCHWLKVHEIPQAGRATKGRAIVNLLDMPKHEWIAAFVNVKEFTEDQYLVMATRQGLVKKTRLSAYSNPRRGGINAISIRDGDALMAAQLSDGNHDVFLATNKGMAIRFLEKEARDMGRTASGVKGIQLGKDDYVVAMFVIKREGTVLAVTEKGYGKRTHLKEYRVSHRGGKGIFTIKVTEDTGGLVTIKEVMDDDDIMIITSKGIVIRQSVEKLRVQGRNTRGFRLIRLDEEDRVADVARVIKEEEA